MSPSTSTASAAALRTRAADDAVIYYPDSDGRPMAENDQQYRCIVETRFALEQYYRMDPETYVGADMLIYYEEGDPTKSVAPDVFVVREVPKRVRRTFLIWAEGKRPDVVFEFASPSSWRADVGWKRGLYEGLGVREYFLFDPVAEYFSPVLRGYRLEGETYVPIQGLGSERGEIGLRSEVLSLELWCMRGRDPQMPKELRLFDCARGEWLPTPEEEAEARRRAEARVAELQAELDRLKSK